MKIDLKRIIRKAITILVIGSAAAGWLGGAEAGLGFILGGVLMIGSFGASWWMTRSAEKGAVGGIAALTTLKFPIIAVLAWVLLSNFPPLAVALGGMVLISSISLDAYSSLRLQPSTANTTGNT